MKKNITINARKFGGEIHRSWNCELIEQIDTLLIFVGVFKDEIVHPELGIIRPGTVSYEYYWLDRWYNIFRFHEPEGALRNFYCNINLPPTFEAGVLDYVDLDIDLLVSENFQIKVLDLEEFEINSVKFNYPKPVIEKAFASLTDLISLAEQRHFPFNFPY